MDECTANVDTETASLLQSTIANECRGMTVITIVHRISTVLNMDHILILDHGNLVSFSFLKRCLYIINFTLISCLHVLFPCTCRLNKETHRFFYKMSPPYFQVLPKLRQCNINKDVNVGSLRLWFNITF